jgi:hypothetical protein
MDYASFMISLQLALFGLALAVSVIAFAASAWSSLKESEPPKQPDSSPDPLSD